MIYVMTDGEEAARGILDELQDAITARDLDRLARLFDDDVALFGTAAANVDRAATLAYLARVVDQDATIRWGWEQVVPLVSQRDVLAFAVVGSVGLDAVDGNPLGERQPFRLTCVAVADGERWRLRHFHGSIPEQG